jgi:hypothetical protein
VTRILLDLTVSFVVLGLIEAVVKPIAVKWTRRRIVATAPQVLEMLDILLPDALKVMSGDDLDRFVRTAFSSLTGDDWSKENLDYFWELYDPRISADRVLSE